MSATSGVGKAGCTAGSRSGGVTNSRKQTDASHNAISAVAMFEAEVAHWRLGERDPACAQIHASILRSLILRTLPFAISTL